jgi:NADH-quinone oxidoreductase subunit G/NADP-reducing hydrogenase subunit HndD
MIQLIINKKKISVAPGTTILEAAKQNGINIPYLCYMEGVHKFGSCRICSVEVEGARTLQIACMAEAKEGMVVHTNSKKVLKARKVLYQLLLSDHSKNCLSCNRNQSCELQQLGDTLGVMEPRFDTGSAREQIDISPSITRDLSKCILCRRCITICKGVQGIGILDAQGRGFDSVIAPAMDHSINNAKCAFCGQCTVVCPVGALRETDHIERVWEALNDPEIRVVMQPAPAIRVALGEMFDYPVGTSVTGKMAAAMRALGADDVFDTDWAADLTIMEEGTEFLQRAMDAVAGKKAILPLITSCSPGWIKYIESYYPQLTPHLSTCKSPHMMLGALAKSYYAKKIKIDPKKMYTVSVMPCTAKKFEAGREEMVNNGVPNVDAVLTTRELGQMIKQAGIDFRNLEDGKFDDPMGQSTGAADIFGVTGGVMEAALRTVYVIITGRELPFDGLHVTPIVGLDQIKEATIKLENVLPEYKMFEGFEVQIAVTSGLAGAKILMDHIVEGKSPDHFIEVMGCPSGCICGGGQPRSDDPDVRMKRLKAIYTEDESRTLRQSHLNPSITAIYQEFLGKPCGHLSHELLHTHYFDRSHENDE